MPNFDAGHYFLTALIPVRTDAADGAGVMVRHRQELGEVLARLPTVEQSSFSRGKGGRSPFTRCTRTHFSRFVVLDDVIFNGRPARDALWGAIIGGLSPSAASLAPGKVDRLSCPFLLWACDFDANDASDGTLSAYLQDLWGLMEAELRLILAHAVGFETVRDAAGFAAYIRRCQLETTLPFNDYWATPPALQDASLALPLGLAGLGALLLLLALFFRHGHLAWFGLLAVLAAVVWAYQIVRAAGLRPFPAASPPTPKGDLPTVLKALAVQAAFTRFAIQVQGLGADELHARFAEFIASQQLDDTSSATQAPGVIGT